MGEAPLPAGINPNYFPAKLWRLVNSPLFRSVRWDDRGEVVLVDQPLFESEVLGGGQGPHFFQTKNFSSFIRQLNLYGFHKLVTELAGGEEGSEDYIDVVNDFSGPLLQFHNPNFRRDRPDLLGHLIRLTSGNKAKLAAGQEVTSRPARHIQGLQVLGQRELPPPSMFGPSGRPGLMTVGQLHQPYHQGSFFPYSYIPTSTQNHGTLATGGSDQTPIPSRMCQGSFGLLPGHETTPTFPDNRTAFPVLQRFPTTVMCTLQSVASLVPLQQASQPSTSFPRYSSYAPPMQYSPAYYLTGALQCYSTPAHVNPLSSCAGPAAPIYTQCSFFQNPPMQSPYTAEFLPSTWPCNTSEENKKTEVDLEDVFQMVDELHSLPKAEMVKVETVESRCSIHQHNRGQPLVNSENIGTASSAMESQLEPLSSVAPDTLFVTGTDQAATCSPSQPSELLCATPTTASGESAAAAEMVQESVTTQEACEKLREQPDQCAAQSSAMFAQEGPFGPEQENAVVECESSTSEAEKPQFTSGTEPLNKSVEETQSSVKQECRKRRFSSPDINSSDLPSAGASRGTSPGKNEESAKRARRV